MRNLLVILFLILGKSTHAQDFYGLQYSLYVSAIEKSENLIGKKVAMVYCYVTDAELIDFHSWTLGYTEDGNPSYKNEHLRNGKTNRTEYRHDINKKLRQINGPYQNGLLRSTYNWNREGQIFQHEEFIEFNDTPRNLKPWRKKSFFYEYDSSGKMLKSVERELVLNKLRDEYSIDTVNITEFENGRIKSNIYPDKWNPIHEVHQYTFNADSSLMTEIIERNVGIGDTIEHTFLEGRKVAQIHKDGKQFFWKYDTKGRVISMKFSDVIMSMAYNNQGSVSEMKIQYTDAPSVKNSRTEGYRYIYYP